jgi:hypothetical protein
LYPKKWLHTLEFDVAAIANNTDKRIRASLVTQWRLGGLGVVGIRGQG